MKLIKSSFEIIEPTGYTLNDIYKSIELAGKVSHKSESSIKEDSAKKFVDSIINWGHNSCLEFGTVYLNIPTNTFASDLLDYKVRKYIENKYSVCASYMDANKQGYLAVTTNYRTIVENNWYDDLKYLCAPTQFHLKKYTVKFLCSRSISHEFVRHRVFSFMQESQRYCLYTANKFDNEITFIKPCWLKDNICKPYENEIAVIKDIDNLGEVESEFLVELSRSETCYKRLIKQGWKAEEAREVLPNATKTELYMCGYSIDWKHFFELRDDKQHAHPQAYELAHPLHQEFLKRNYIYE